MTELLSIEGLSKAYPGVLANDQVGLSIAEGEVHALLGENGAGKSTLVKMIYGLVRPDSGTMTLGGAPFRPAEPRAARAAGVAMVFQHFSLFDALTVAENITLGMEDAPPRRELARRITDVSQTYKLPLDPGRIIGDLSVGERQRVEIIRCLLQNPRLLIMDEPTSVLTPQEVEVLFETLNKLASEGTAILYISHKLEEIRTLCHHATILRQGKVVDHCDPTLQTARKLAEMMVGSSFQTPTRKRLHPGDVVLEVDALSLKSQYPFGTSLNDINLKVRSGEIMGIGGVAGNGQDEFLLAMAGEMPVARDMIRVDGIEVGDLTPNERREIGLQAAPEERLGHAATPDMSLVENALLTGNVRQKLSANGFLRLRAARGFTRAIVEKYDVRTPGIDNSARSLSGGNLQKFVIGREILQNPRVLVVNQPTWGVDAAAAAAIRQALLDLAEAGAALVVISQDLDELLEISDRLAILHMGELSQPRETLELTMEEIGLMMGGMEAGDAAA
ncbi:MAG: ABC transporter ATP-binding protein [Paracoccaceae bacterium]